MGDILRTVAVLGLLIVVLWGVGRFFTVTPDDPVRADDYAQTADSAREAASYALLAPPSLPEGWISNGARFDPSTDAWHLGVVTSDDDYIGLEQIDEDVDKVVERFTPQAEPDGETTIDGTTWTRLKAPNGETTLVHRGADVTTLVTGDAPLDVMKSYVASLSAS